MTTRRAKEQGNRFDRAEAIFKQHGGLLRTSQALHAGIHPGTLYAMRDSGKLVRVSRGVYRLADSPPLGNPDLVTVASRIPAGVICLVSALAFHGLTDQLPKKVWMAIGRNDWTPKPSDMPIRVLRFSDDLLADSVETHVIEGVSVKVFGAAKTVADCFRHRGKIGLAVALEGLQEALRQRKATPAEIAKAADTGGVGTVIRPYLEALTTNG